MYDTHAGITFANDVRLPALEPLISINAPIVTGDFVGATVVTDPDDAAAADVDNELFDDELLHAPDTNTPAAAPATHTVRQRREERTRIELPPISQVCGDPATALEHYPATAVKSSEYYTV
jgi:hypothetical protein